MPLRACLCTYCRVPLLGIILWCYSSAMIDENTIDSWQMYSQHVVREVKRTITPVWLVLHLLSVCNTLKNGARLFEGLSQLHLPNPPMWRCRVCYRSPLLKWVHLMGPRRIFSIVAPSLWNIIPMEVTLVPTISVISTQPTNVGIQGML